MQSNTSVVTYSAFMKVVMLSFCFVLERIEAAVGGAVQFWCDLLFVLLSTPQIIDSIAE